MDLTQELKVIQDKVKAETADYDRRIAEQKQKYNDLLAATEAIQKLVALDQVCKAAEAAGVSPHVWVLEAIENALVNPGASCISVRTPVYQKLAALAEARGITINLLTERYSFTEAVLSALQRGSV
jgi:hypothetical protein